MPPQAHAQALQALDDAWRTQVRKHRVLDALVPVRVGMAIASLVLNGLIALTGIAGTALALYRQQWPAAGAVGGGVNVTTLLLAWTGAGEVEPNGDLARKCWPVPRVVPLAVARLRSARRSRRRMTAGERRSGPDEASSPSPRRTWPPV